MSFVKHVIWLSIAFELFVNDLISITNRVIFPFECSERCKNGIVDPFVKYNLFEWIKSVQLLQITLILYRWLGIFSISKIVKDFRIETDCFFNNVLGFCKTCSVFEEDCKAWEAVETLGTEVA